MSEQKVIKGKAAEPTNEDLMAIPTAEETARMLAEVVAEQTGNPLPPQPEKKPEPATEAKPEEKPEPAPAKPEDKPKEEKKADLTEALSKYLGLVKPPEPKPVDPAADPAAEVAERAKALAARERAVEMKEELAALTELINGMSEVEAPLIVEKVSELINTPEFYGELFKYTPDKRAAKLITEARGILHDKLIEAREAAKAKEAEAKDTLRKVITAPEAQPSGGSDDEAKTIKDLLDKANSGDEDARAELLLRSYPQLNDYVNKDE